MRNTKRAQVAVNDQRKEHAFLNKAVQDCGTAVKSKAIFRPMAEVFFSPVSEHQEKSLC